MGLQRDDTAGDDASLNVTIVHACLRDGTGGSPTAVLAETELDEPARRRVPVICATSHAVFVGTGPPAALRFWTATGELPACGHGTIAGLAYLAAAAARFEVRLELHTPAGVLIATAESHPDAISASFEAGVPRLRPATAAERGLARAAFGPGDAIDSAGAIVAGLGRERLLVPVASRPALAALVPDLQRLRAGCDALGLLGAYVHAPPGADGRLAARMFAPSIGVPEDVANANSTACLAAALARDGHGEITAEMGDALSQPSAITARARTRAGETRITVSARAALGAAQGVARAQLRG